MFDLDKLKSDTGLSTQQMTHLEQQVRAEFPDDEMMFELHVMRILEAIRHGWLTIEAALIESAPQT